MNSLNIIPITKARSMLGDLADTAITEVLGKMGFKIDDNDIRELKQINKVVKR